MTVELFLFSVIGILAVVSAGMMLVSKNAVHSALFMIVNFGCVAVLFLLLNAPFLSMVQIVVYAGAIMVLFLFVIMLLGAEQTTDTTHRFAGLAVAATILAGILLFIISAPLVNEFNLSESKGPNPVLRVVHAMPDLAEAGDVTAQNFNVYLDGEPLIEEYGFSFGDVVDYTVLTPGEEHTLSFTTEFNGNEASVLDQPITLESGEVKTAIIYGESIVFPQFTMIDSTLDPIEDRSGRITVMNMYSDEVLTLVELGANDRLDTSTFPREVLATDANGTLVFDDSGNPVVNRVQAVDDNGDPVFDENDDPVMVPEMNDSATVITDPVLLRYIRPDVPSEAVSYSAGTYNLALVNQRGEIVQEFREVKIERGTDRLFLYGPETQFDGQQRPTLIGAKGLTTKALYSFGGPHDVGQLLFTRYMLPVQMVGVLLLIALVGVVTLTRPVRITRERHRREKVSRPLVNVISAQTGRDVFQGTPQLDKPSTEPDASGD